MLLTAKNKFYALIIYERYTDCGIPEQHCYPKDRASPEIHVHRHKNLHLTCNSHLLPKNVAKQGS